MARRKRITNTLPIEPGRAFSRPAADSRAHVHSEPVQAGARELRISSCVLPRAPVQAPWCCAGIYQGIETCH